MSPHAPPNRWADRWANSGYWLSWLALIGSLLSIVATYGINQRYDALLYNSDAMFIPVFYRDLLQRGDIRGWDLPTNPYFFPDMALFIPLLALIHKIHLAAILYGMLQLLLLIAGVLLLQRHLSGTSRWAQAITLLTLTLCMLLIATGKQIFYAYALMSVHHMGTLVVMPFATVAMLQALQPERSTPARRRAASILFALTLITSLSDTLFIIQFVLPAIFASLLWGKYQGSRWRDLLFLNGGVVLSAAAGQWLRQWIVPISKFLVYAERDEGMSAASFSNFVDWSRQAAANDPLFALFWLTSLLALLAVALLGLRQQPNGQNENRPLALVATLFLGSMFLSVLAAIVSGNFEDAFSARYLLPTLYLPILVGWPLFFATWLPFRERQVNVSQQFAPTLAATTSALSLTAITYILYALVTGQPITYAALIDHEDSFVACLERESAQRQIRHGLADYWQADSTTALSEGALNIVPVATDLSPIFWNNNPARYQAPFEFVMIHKHASADRQLREEVILQKWGQPAGTFECESSKIYLYNRPSDLQIRRWFANRPEFVAESNKLAHVGDAVAFYGYALPSAIGGVAIGLSQGVSEQWGNGDGTLAYARLQALPAASYAVAFDLYADSANTGSWEVVSISEDGVELLQIGAIESTGKSTMTGYFDLQQESDVEIRVKYAGHGILFVDKLRIARVDPAQAASFDFAASPAPPPASDAPAVGTLNLIHPYAGGYIESGNVDFAWQWTGQPLPKNQTFEVRLWRKGDTIHYGAHDAKAGAELIRQIDDTYSLRLDLNGAHSVIQHGAGEYEWTVGIVEIEPEYRDLQIEAVPYTLNLLP
jgi:hypothetical protein